MTTSAWPNNLHPLESSLLDAILTNSPAPALGESVDEMLVATWLEAQITSRLLDHAARRLRADHGIGYYTIGSAGHESNAIVATALRTHDPALLHYRSGGFYVARALQADHPVDPVRDVLRAMMAKSTDQIAGGRHKVFGNHGLSIIPQTSTIASHLPRAVGLALSGSYAPDAETTWPTDAVVVCSFGDGSLNHSTTQGALNWAAHSDARGERVPVLFVCEDNGLGLSVPTPPGWVASSLLGRPGFATASADGSDPLEVWKATTYVVDEVRSSGRPGILHVSTVRYLGHAGTDVESAYRSSAEMAADVTRDPILGVAKLAAATGVSSPRSTVEWYLDMRASIDAVAMEVVDEPELVSASEVMQPLAGRPRAQPSDPDAATSADASGEPLTLAQTITHTLASLLDASDDVIIFGEDVGRKGGAYGLTRGLRKRFGDRRVFDTLLDEQSILGLALGSALNGRLPIPEIQYLAYLHNAEDQLRGEAATLGFFSKRQYTNPMVVRIAGYGYQKGFGGHFHNDNSIAVLRDIPGVVIASPAHPSDAGPMLRGCVAHARETGDVCVFVEPIARYHDGDLHESGDRLWSAPFDPAALVRPGRARVHPLATAAPHVATADFTPPEPDDLTIITFGNGVWLSLRAQRRLHRDHGVRARVVDLRWIAPLPLDDVLTAARATGRVLIVDETRQTGGVAESIVAALVSAGFPGPIDAVAARDSFVPLGAAANLVLVSEDDIMDAALACSSRNR
ncbi:MAG: thiamine pyrophosphate-dependent enzyme [Ilumatobacter sp.]